MASALLSEMALTARLSAGSLAKETCVETARTKRSESKENLTLIGTSRRFGMCSSGESVGLKQWGYIRVVWRQRLNSNIYKVAVGKGKRSAPRRFPDTTSKTKGADPILD
jgi:hypothetical protein